MAGKNRWNRSRGNNGNKGGASERIKTAWALCGAMRIFPPPKTSKQSDDAYLKLMHRLIMTAMRKAMSNLGQILVDPELPDSYEAFMGAMLLPNISTPAEFSEAMDALEVIAAAAEAGVTTDPDGNPISPSAGIDAETLANAQTWQSNTEDWWSQTVSGDWTGGSESFAEGWDSFWSGNFM